MWRHVHRTYQYKTSAQSKLVATNIFGSICIELVRHDRLVEDCASFRSRCQPPFFVCAYDTRARRLQRTLQQVITLFPDLTLAVEEGEPDLAHDFFSTVKVGR